MVVLRIYSLLLPPSVRVALGLATERAARATGSGALR